MPIRPNMVWKFVCPKCGYRKIHRPRSDALNPMEFHKKCPKCDIYMDTKKLNTFDKIIYNSPFGKHI